MLKEFKDFLLRGNVVDLAIAVIIGAAFNGIVTSLVKDVFTPIIGMIIGQPDFSAITIGSIMIGNFINAVVNFLIVGTVLFVVVKGMEKSKELTAKKEEVVEEEAAPTAEDYLKEIRDLLAEKK